MKKELAYFTIQDSYGVNQNWLSEPMMKLGGCSVIVSCNICIYLKILKGYDNLYPFNINSLKKRDILIMIHKI